MSDMKGKVALITGASSGIGRATALLFVEKGVSVVVAARRQEELDALVKEIESKGGKASAIKTDVANSKEVEQMVAHTIAVFGRLDYAVNNACVEGQFNSVIDLPEEEWDRVLDINLKGTFLCMRYEAKAMLKLGFGGAIVNVGSINSFLGFPTGSPYVASKHGMVGLTTSVSAELASQGIRVNIVCPGIIDTAMHRRLRGIIGDEIYDNAIMQSIHLKRAGLPEEIAKTILFLCSDEASYITGTTLSPDGGFALTV